MKQIKELSETQKAYLAGLFDGEGHIGFYGGKLNFIITQAESGSNVLHMVHEWVGAGGVYLHRKATGNWQAVYRFRIQSNNLVNQLMDALDPHLRIKKRPPLS